MANKTTGWVGWIAFASTFMVLAGFFQIIFGLTALFQDDVIITAPSNVWLVDLTTWGWAHMLFGILLLFGGMALIAGSMWARILAVFLAGLSAIVNFAFIPVYPLWSIMLIIFDALIIYAVIAHGSEVKEIYT